MLPVAKVTVTVHGDLATVDTKMLTVSALMGVLSNLSGEQPNIINAEIIAREKGIHVVEAKNEESKRYVNMISLALQSDGVSEGGPGDRLPRLRAPVAGDRQL